MLEVYLAENTGGKLSRQNKIDRVNWLIANLQNVHFQMKPALASLDNRLIRFIRVL